MVKSQSTDSPEESDLAGTESSSGPRRACVIVHDPGSEAAMVGRYLETLGYEQIEVPILTDLRDPTGSARGLGSPTDYDIIVAMGCIYSLASPEPIESWIWDELRFLRQADEAGVPVLGICFGGQALAAAHGGRVVAAEAPQVGWHPLRPLDDASALTGPWFQWHVDRFEAPPDSRVLARDAVGIQAFRLRRNLAVQFHPEVDRKHLERWAELGGESEFENYGVDLVALLDETDRQVMDSSKRVVDLVDYFLTDVALTPES